MREKLHQSEHLKKLNCTVLSLVTRLSKFSNIFKIVPNSFIGLKDENIYLYHFLAVQNSSIGDLVTDSLTDSLRVLLLLTLQSDPRDL